ncbi:magnesium-translocating P-type ATPase [Candidatus Saccharibacteria bacterium]|nr:magnesium-translocating P-type ATPase [Candidatus Saccharibacteria bacterium]
MHLHQLLLGKAKKTKERNQNLTERRLKTLSKLPMRELIEKFDITFSSTTKEPEGLSWQDVNQKAERFGPNEITLTSKETTMTRIVDAIVNPFNIVLFIIAIVSYTADKLSYGEVDWTTIIMIMAMILISSIVSFVQGERSSRAAAKLASMVNNTASVYRSGEVQELPLADLVPGDIVKLSAGDMVPADIRFLSTKDTFIAQAALTGESEPVEKFAHARPESNSSLTDSKNLGFMGTNVISGSATAVVLTTGNNTYFGSMAKTLSGKTKNSFERGVASVSRLLIVMVVVMVPLVFVLNGVLKADWTSSLLFAVSVAVGLTPEMLPVIMTTTLATGAVTMSKHKVIVKQLGAIQTFGEMDILATDKTGTLTEDKIILEEYLDIHGKSNTHVLEFAYLNAYFQTGLKGLLDIAVIKRAEKNGHSSLIAEYTVVDEIPFDFTRRRLSVVLRGKGRTRILITKGAVEEMLDICSRVEINGKIQPLTDEYRKIAMKTYEKYNHDGLRMLALAEKPLHGFSSKKFGVKDEADLILTGFVGFLDPPKESAREALSSLKAAGIKVVVMTGDSLGVASYVCKDVGIDPNNALSGQEVSAMEDEALKPAVKDCQLFYKLSPAEKERLVRILQEDGHTVGYMGDGINDAPPLHQADVGISVDTAVDIAKETAEIILLKKDLTVLEEGVIEGRRTFGNVNKYIKLAVSGNFGNMFSVLFASAFLPFLPMLPIQILTQNLLADFSVLGLPLDNVDKEYLKKPRKWSPRSITTFMIFAGITSSIFDILCFGVLWFIFGFNTTDTIPLFWAGWFIFGSLSQILIIHVARTGKIPFLQSRPSIPLIASTFSVGAVALLIAFSPAAASINMGTLPIIFLIPLAILLIGYFLAVQLVKVIYKKFFHEWL